MNWSKFNPHTGRMNECPICSYELSDLALNVPYAQHTKSIVPNDPVMLPNGHIYGRDHLKRYNEEQGTPQGWVKDPDHGWDGQMWKESEVRTVYIS